VRIYKKFGDHSASVITHQPFKLAREVWGIGFKTADRIAQAVGIAPDAPERLQAGVLHALGAAADEGHTLLPESETLRRAAELLEADHVQIGEALSALMEAGEVTAAERDDQETHLVAITPFARAESSLAGRLLGLSRAGEWSAVGRTFQNADWQAAFNWLASRHDLRLAPEQEAGVKTALTSPITILTGGPGTGKTHTLKGMLALAQAKRLRCLLAAPTGRAAKRMEEATGLAATTLHRLLELRPGASRVEKTLQADLVIVDEVSMLDSLLANQLVKAVVPGSHLVLVGDPDQLPSVGAGDVLADLLRAARFPVTRLQHIFRQGAGSGIAENARRINEGQMPQFGEGIADCFFLPADDPAAAAQLTVDLVAERLPRRYGFKAGEVHGDAGVGALNLRLQERLNPLREGAHEARAGGRIYRVGDRVLQLRNDYDLKVFNGDLGTIQSVDTAEHELTLLLDDGRTLQYPFASLYALSHAWSLSVHKAQGAEFPAVVVPLLMNHAPMLGRTLLYTAVTRARQLVVIVGQRRALALAVKDWRREKRWTALDGLLAGSIRYLWPLRDAAMPEGTDDVPDLWGGLAGAEAA
jgi:exodeoxyribonuclease V alpha subunit